MPKRFSPLLIVLLAGCAFAQAKDLTINADNLSYDRDNKIINATGSVEIVYRDVTVRGNEITYNTALNRLWADRGFSLNYGEISLEGKTLDYDLKVKNGQATDVNFLYRGIKLSGRQIGLSEEAFQLKNAAFSTCDLEMPHYRVTAADILFYPEYGWLVAYWGYFWLGPFPLVPLPTYIYDMRAAEKARQNLPPFPEVGNNDQDGTFINERLAWHLKRELSGSYSLTYATKKGIGGGVEANYLIDEDSRGNARLNGNVNDGLFGGVTHSWFFGGQVTAKQDPSGFSFLNIPKQRQYQLDATLSYHERINYQRISFYPDLNLKSRRAPFPLEPLSGEYELFAGQISEQNSARQARGGGKFNLYWDRPVSLFGELTPVIGLDARYYSGGGSWVKKYTGLELNKPLATNINFGLGYTHYFSVDGVSPFNFELYRFRAADRLRSRLTWLVGETGLGLNASYFLDTWQPEDLDYSLFVKMHCYNLQVQYRSLRHEFTLGFSLAGGA